MTLAAIIELIKGVLTFPKEVSALIRLLQKTGSQQDADIVSKAQSDWDAMQKDRRPRWD